ncbi:hypothetical protein M0802_000842 [Mischocyttarus mexicanus]|nr:hypothetical protein M0802_000842 [Mischocyttarus mexicanus]
MCGPEVCAWQGGSPFVLAWRKEGKERETLEWATTRSRQLISPLFCQFIRIYTSGPSAPAAAAVAAVATRCLPTTP